MRLTKNEPKVVQVVLTRGDLLSLLAQFDTGQTPEAFIANRDDASGYLVKITVEPGSPLDKRRYQPTLPAKLQESIDRTEGCLGKELAIIDKAGLEFADPNDPTKGFKRKEAL